MSTVMLNAVMSYRIYVIGKVAKSGPIMSEKPINVLQALSMAGGLAEYAKKNEISIMHTTFDAQGNPHYSVAQFRYDDVGKDGGTQNIMLQSDDVINVP